MNLQNVKNMLMRHEGSRVKPYIDTVGKKTIGIGHNMDASPLPEDMAAYLKEHGEITPAMIDALLEHDIKLATEGCEILFPAWKAFSDNRQDALIDFVFNVGLGKVKTFVHALASIRAGDWSVAADEMQKSAWYKQVHGRGIEICRMIRVG